jgi:hypothetical protein
MHEHRMAACRTVVTFSYGETQHMIQTVHFVSVETNSWVTGPDQSWTHSTVVGTVSLVNIFKCDIYEL